MRSSSRLVIPLMLAATLAACSAAPRSGRMPDPANSSAVMNGAGQMAFEIHASPTCSCCHEWTSYLDAAGAHTSTVAEHDMPSFKMSHAVPQALWSCHTATIGGYMVEGHVPIAAVERLLAERPAVAGIAVAGMPAGSPGMPGQLSGPLQVMAFSPDGITLFGEY